MLIATPPAEAHRPIDVLALGEAMVEFNEREPGSGLFVQGFGGDTSNCAVAAARLGARSAYLTHVGDDAFGDDLLALWQREQVDVSGVSRVGGGDTGVYFVRHGRDGHHFAYRRRGSPASAITPQALAGGQVERARWLHVSGISQAIGPSAHGTVAAAIERAGAAGTRVSYDLNFRPALWPAAQALAAARDTLPRTDLFFPSIDEVTALTGIADPGDVIRWAHDHGARWVALKLGVAGCKVSDGERTVHVAPHPVRAVDATGAGDCFAGALLARLSAGDALPVAARAANVAAALSTLGRGAVAPLPTWAAVSACLD